MLQTSNLKDLWCNLAYIILIGVKVGIFFHDRLGKKKL